MFLIDFCCSFLSENWFNSLPKSRTCLMLISFLSYWNLLVLKWIALYERRLNRSLPLHDRNEHDNENFNIICILCFRRISCGRQKPKVIFRRLRMSRRWMLEFRLLNLHILIELVEFPKGSMPCHWCISDQSKLATWEDLWLHL
jgi:hypothetical protein